MKKRIVRSLFNATNALQVISFMVHYLGKEFFASEIQKATSLSKAGVYVALREVVKAKLVIATKKGQVLLYSIPYDNPVAKQYKILQNILFLTPIISKIQSSSKKIILYGSATRGEDTIESDIDLFVVTAHPEEVRKIVSRIKTKRTLQVVIKTPSEIIPLKEKDALFYNEVLIGITLWEEKE